MAKHFALDIADGQLRVPPQARADRSRGAARRHLRDPHQPAGRRHRTPRRPCAAYKDLARVERAFRTLKARRSADPARCTTGSRHRVRAHVFLCMLAYYVEWHMREAWRRCCSTSTTLPAPRPNDLAGPGRRGLAGHPAQARHPAHRGRPAGRRLRRVDAAPRHPDPEHRRRAEGARRRLHHARQADAAAGRRPRTPRRQPTRVQEPARLKTKKPRQNLGRSSAYSENFGLGLPCSGRPGSV